MNSAGNKFTLNLNRNSEVVLHSYEYKIAGRKYNLICITWKKLTLFKMLHYEYVSVYT